MIHLVGPSWPSKTLLQQALSEHDLPEAELVVCWGGQAEGGLNNVPRIGGQRQLELFRKAGLNAPEATGDVEVAKDWARQGYLTFGRRQLHSKGSDIVGFRHRRWLRSEYWVKVLRDVEQEWRVHVFLGKAIARGLKVQVEPPWRKLPVRNRGNGWRMVHDVEPPEGLRGVAKRAVGALGYDFGAVDLIVQQGGMQWVLEVNKVPGLDNYTAYAYAGAIVRWAWEQVGDEEEEEEEDL